MSQVYQTNRALQEAVSRCAHTHAPLNGYVHVCVCVCIYIQVENLFSLTVLYVLFLFLFLFLFGGGYFVLFSGYEPKGVLKSWHEKP